MTDFLEITDFTKIDQFNEKFQSTLRALSPYPEEFRKINYERKPSEVHFLDPELWWSCRLFPVSPKQPTQDNNLFGYGRRGGFEPLTSEVEVNFSVGKYSRHTQGAFARNVKTNAVLLVHRGKVRRRDHVFTMQTPGFIEEMKANGTSFISLYYNSDPLIIIGKAYGDVSGLTLLANPA
jgi:hypothetical protein